VNVKKTFPCCFKKFAVDFAERYRTSPIQLDEEAKNLLINYEWKGNVRELKNIAEQISVLSTDKNISARTLSGFLPVHQAMNRLPVLAGNASTNTDFANEREILYKLFFDMKKDVTELKKMFVEILKNPVIAQNIPDAMLHNVDEETMHPHPVIIQPQNMNPQPVIMNKKPSDQIQDHEEVEESLNIMHKEKELIVRALKKHKSRRKDAASDLGISERTLYRKLKEYDIEEL